MRRRAGLGDFRHCCEGVFGVGRCRRYIGQRRLQVARDPLLWNIEQLERPHQHDRRVGRFLGDLFRSERADRDRAHELGAFLGGSAEHARDAVRWPERVVRPVGD